MLKPHAPHLVLSALFAVAVSGCAKSDPGTAPTAGGAPAATATAQADKAAGAGAGKGTAKGGGSRGGGRGGSGAKQAVEVVAIARRDLSESISVVGSLAANESATLRTETNGVVREIRFEEGQPVRKGQVLLKIDDSDLRAQLAQTESRLQLAEATFQRNESLLKTQMVAQADFDRISNDYTSAKGDLELIKVRIGRTEIRAPFDGIVNSRSLSPGDYITNQTVVTTIDDLSRLKIDFQVAERFLGKVKVGTKFTVHAGTVSGQEETAAGEVYFVSPSINRDTRSVQVKGFVASPPASYHPGMFANIELVLDVRKGVLTVPEGAILSSAGGAQVIAVADRGGDSVAQFVTVALGLRVRGLVEISPVNPGDIAEGRSVVASGVGGIQLFNGGRLDPRPLNAAFETGD